MDWWRHEVAAWVAICLCLMRVRGARTSCSMDQFPCRNQHCIPLDQYCDGRKDCSDGSDEIHGCSPCNRTYYGRIGASYRIIVPRPRRGTLPYFCQLTFMASGEIYGDLVQINIEKFNLGRFLSHTTAGCPDGYMQIEELSRPSNTGYWCGSSWGLSVYYSETSSVSVMLRVFNMSQFMHDNPASQKLEEIMLQVSYKFLQRKKAAMRYGVPYNLNYLGQDIPGTFCDRLYENCDKKNCKIQSPNFPGIYPRNLTCFFHVKQTLIPEGRVAMIRLKQENPHLIYIKDRNAPHISKDTRFQLDNTCHILHDYFIIYDGNTTQDSILLKACKGGALSAVTSSSNSVLVEFKVSPFDFPFQDTPRRRVFGFQLDVEVIFVGRESTAYIQRRRMLTNTNSEQYICEWVIDSQGQRSGYVQSPVHSVLPNTTCSWKFLSAQEEIVWLYFLHYRHIRHLEMTPPNHCPISLTLYDGVDEDNSTVVDRFCKRTKYPKVCTGVHSPSGSSSTIPCNPAESYVSETPEMAIVLKYNVGTIPSHVEFLARYEFVDKRLWGNSNSEENECDRVFTESSERNFESPKNVFLFGRGGSSSLQCFYTFRTDLGKRVLLKLRRARMGGLCSSHHVDSSKRYECSHTSNTKSYIRIEELMWPNVYFSRSCVCDISYTNPMIITSYSNEMRLNFHIPHMTPGEDYNDFFFEGEYEYIEHSEQSCTQNNIKYNGSHGNFTIGSPTAAQPCWNLPRLIVAQDGGFLMLKIPGTSSELTQCTSSSRINVFGVGSSVPLVSICPSQDGQFTHVFSNGWFTGQKNSQQTRRTTSIDMFENNWDNTSSFAGYLYPFRHRQTKVSIVPRDLLVEYIGSDTHHLITWVGVWKPIETSLLSSWGADICPHRCYDIEACIPEELWCDGVPHCPTGFDEGARACGLLAALPWVSVVVGLALIFSLVVLLLSVLRHRRIVSGLNIQDPEPRVNGIQRVTPDSDTVPSDKDPLS